MLQDVETVRTENAPGDNVNANKEDMEIDSIKKDLVKICSVVIATNGADQFLDHFPDLSEWANKNISQEDKDEIIQEMLQMIKKDKHVAIEKDDFITLYAHVQAVIGFEETKARFPKLRSLALNLMTEDELQSTLMLIKQIEDLLQQKFSK